MSVWTVTVSDPLNGTVLATVENGVHTGTGEVCIRRFDPPVVTPPGRGKSLNLFVKQTALQVPPRAIVQLALDEEPVFWGPVVTCPPLTAPGAGPFDKDRDALERVTVVGGEQLLKDSIVGPRFLDRRALVGGLGSADVATIAHELCRLYAHPALTVDQDDFVTTGAVLTLFYRPTDTLESCLKVLAETVPGGADWWVDAEGAVHFQAREGGS
jgi:hypothetical protein